MMHIFTSATLCTQKPRAFPPRGFNRGLKRCACPTSHIFYAIWTKREALPTHIQEARK
jgi:hypothetical protein